MLLFDIFFNKAVVFRTSCVSKLSKKLFKKYRCCGPTPNGLNQTLSPVLGIWELTVGQGLDHPLNHHLVPPGQRACSLLQVVPKGKPDVWDKELKKHCLGTLPNFTTLPFSLQQEEVSSGMKAEPQF